MLGWTGVGPRASNAGSARPTPSCSASPPCSVPACSPSGRPPRPPRAGGCCSPSCSPGSSPPATRHRRPTWPSRTRRAAVATSTARHACARGPAVSPGVAFLVGKCASAGAAAAVFGVYVLPSAPLAAALLAVVVATALNIGGRAVDRAQRLRARGRHAGGAARRRGGGPVGQRRTGRLRDARGRPDRGRRGAAGGADRGGPGVLRVRGLRARRDARRRGARPAAHDPAGDRPGAGHRAARLPARGRRSARRARPRSARAAGGAAGRPRRRPGGPRARCARARRGGHGRGLGAVVGAGGDQPDGARDGAGAGPAARADPDRPARHPVGGRPRGRGGHVRRSPCSSGLPRRSRSRRARCSSTTA